MYLYSDFSLNIKYVKLILNLIQKGRPYDDFVRWHN